MNRTIGPIVYRWWRVVLARQVTKEVRVNEETHFAVGKKGRGAAKANMQQTNIFTSSQALSSPHIHQAQLILNNTKRESWQRPAVKISSAINPFNGPGGMSVCPRQTSLLLFLHHTTLSMCDWGWGLEIVASDCEDIPRPNPNGASLYHHATSFGNRNKSRNGRGGIQ